MKMSVVIGREIIYGEGNKITQKLINAYLKVIAINRKFSKLGYCNGNDC